MARVNRYFAEYTETNSLLQSGWDTCWQVFDREVTEPGTSDPISVAMCRNRNSAFKIRDALNASETENA